MHRYIPYPAKNAGFTRIGEKVVHHQARKYGKTKFGLDRFGQRISRSGHTVVHQQVWRQADALFGLLGSLMFLFSALWRPPRGHHKTLPHAHRPVIFARHRLAIFLHLARHDDTRHTAVPTGFLGELIVRNLAATQRLRNRRGTTHRKAMNRPLQNIRDRPYGAADTDGLRDRMQLLRLALENQSSIPLAGFYSASTEERVVIDSIKVYGLGAPGDSARQAPSERRRYICRSDRRPNPPPSASRYLQKDLDTPN